MGIQSTTNITRESAIERINRIQNLVKAKDYLEIENSTFESDDVYNFVEQSIVISGITKWTNTMLEAQMDKPFYRFSMFDNYFVGRDVN